MKSKLPLDPAKLKLQPQRMADKKPFQAWVLRVNDGDTIQVARERAGQCFTGIEFVRLAAIDAPEMKGFDARCALWSQQFLQDLLLGEEVTVRPRRIWRDPYHRIIADVALAGQDVGTCLIEHGHAVVRKNHACLQSGYKPHSESL